MSGKMQESGLIGIFLLIRPSLSRGGVLIFPILSPLWVYHRGWLQWRNGVGGAADSLSVSILIPSGSPLRAEVVADGLMASASFADTQATFFIHTHKRVEANVPALESLLEKKLAAYCASGLNRKESCQKSRARTPSRI